MGCNRGSGETGEGSCWEQGRVWVSEDPRAQILPRCYVGPWPQSPSFLRAPGPRPGSSRPCPALPCPALQGATPAPWPGPAQPSPTRPGCGLHWPMILNSIKEHTDIPAASKAARVPPPTPALRLWGEVPMLQQLVQAGGAWGPEHVTGKTAFIRGSAPRGRADMGGGASPGPADAPLRRGCWARAGPQGQGSSHISKTGRRGSVSIPANLLILMGS